MDIGSLENEAGEVVMGNKEMAEELNRYFASVFTVEDNSSISEHQESQGAEVSPVAINKEKVLGKLGKSSRPGGLHQSFLKEIAEEVVE
eukprot:g24764.t1